METTLHDMAQTGADMGVMYAISVMSVLGSSYSPNLGLLCPAIQQTAMVMEVNDQHTKGLAIWERIKQAKERVQQTLQTRPVRSSLFPFLRRR